MLSHCWACWTMCLWRATPSGKLRQSRMTSYTTVCCWGKRPPPRSSAIFWERSFPVAEIRLTFLGTGAGNCIHRAHTAMVIDCADGTRVLLDTGSGNSVLRHGAPLGMLAADYQWVLPTHRHA